MKGKEEEVRVLLSFFLWPHPGTHTGSLGQVTPNGSFSSNPSHFHNKVKQPGGQKRSLLQIIAAFQHSPTNLSAFFARWKHLMSQAAVSPHPYCRGPDSSAPRTAWFPTP